jgi:transposase
LLMGDSDNDSHGKSSRSAAAFFVGPKPPHKRYVKINAQGIKVCAKMQMNGSTYQQIATHSGQSIRNVQRVLQKTEGLGLISDASINYSIKKRGPKPRNEDPQKREIEDILQADSSLTRKGNLFNLILGISDKLSDAAKVTEDRVGKLLCKMGFTRKILTKIPIERNSANVIEQRKAYCEMIDSLPDKKILFLDETGFNLHTSNNWGYSPKGQPAIASIPASRGRNLSLLSVISMTGLIAYAIVDGPVNGKLFLSFLDLDFYPRRQCDDFILCMDNARIHHVDAVRKWAITKAMQIVYLPPYTPQLNPNENVFSAIKNKYHMVKPRPKNNEEMRNMLITILDSFISADFEGYYKNMREYVEKGKHGELFMN